MSDIFQFEVKKWYFWFLLFYILLTRFPGQSRCQHLQKQCPLPQFLFFYTLFIPSKTSFLKYIDKNDSLSCHISNRNRFSLIRIHFIFLTRYKILNAWKTSDHILLFSSLSFVGNTEIDVDVKRYYCKAGIKSIQVSPIHTVWFISHLCGVTSSWPREALDSEVIDTKMKVGLEVEMSC